jgi:class 3 adenylate cyclase
VGLTREQLDTLVEATDKSWGEATFANLFAPSAASDEGFLEWFRRFERMAASPASAASVLRMAAEIDVRHLLPSVRVSTLVIHRTGDLVMPVEGARYMAERIPASRFVELPGNDHFGFVSDQNAIIDEIEEFLTGTKHVVEIDRTFATVLFTDIVHSTERAVALGDNRWRDLLEAHHAIVRKNLAHFRGQEVDTAGDDFLATFDGPARGVGCALTIRDDLHRLGVEIRAGLHTGECELIGGKVGGLAVHIGARVAGAAEPGEVIVSNTVKDLVAGSGIRFVDRGAHALKGLPDEYHLFAAG